MQFTVSLWIVERAPVLEFSWKNRQLSLWEKSPWDAKQTEYWRGRPDSSTQPNENVFKDSYQFNQHDKSFLFIFILFFF